VYVQGRPKDIGECLSVSAPEAGGDGHTPRWRQSTFQRDSHTHSLGKGEIDPVLNREAEERNDTQRL